MIGKNDVQLADLQSENVVEVVQVVEVLGHHVAQPVAVRVTGKQIRTSHGYPRAGLHFPLILSVTSELDVPVPNNTGSAPKSLVPRFLNLS